jgi:L-threonylcarbamoyladenylate synthase
MTKTVNNIKLAAEKIREGGLVGFPTETVYGLGANALNAAAVAAVFELKKRPRFDPLIVHIADPDELPDLVQQVPLAAMKLIERFWPGPLSLVLQKQACIPDIVTAGLPTVAIRCPDHDMARALIREARVPISAPSANRFGMVSPTTADHVTEQFGNQLAMVLDDGPCRVGVESTVISFVETPDARPMMLRPGGVSLEEIEAAIGRVATRTRQPRHPTSPGQLASHYSPATPLVIADDHDVTGEAQRVGLLCLQPPANAADFAAIEVLSEQGCLREAAVNLFAAIRRLDALNLDCIVARPVPEIDLGRAIMDRLRRASAK